MFVDAITLVHLPDGPTAYFKLTSIELTKKIFVGGHSFCFQDHSFMYRVLHLRDMHDPHPTILSSCSIIL
jgi:hypothetical protein